MGKIIFTTLAPSPHLTPILNRYDEKGEHDLYVIFEHKMSSVRKWNPGVINFKHCVLNSFSYRMKTSLDINIFRVLNNQSNVGLVIIGTSPWSINTWLIVCWCKFNKIKYVTFSEPPTRKVGIGHILKKAVHNYFYSNALGFISVTKKTSEYFNSLYGNRPSIVVPYQTNLTKFLDIPIKEKDEITKFLFLGAFTETKNVEYLAHQFSNLSSENVTLTFVGEGGKKQTLDMLCKRDNRMKVLPFVDSECVYKLMSDFDCLILPSKDDGYGMVVVEALAAGLPVITSNNVMSGIELIKNDINGWIFDLNVENDLLNTLNKSISSNLAFFSKNARKSIRHDDVLDKSVNEIDRLYKVV